MKPRTQAFCEMYISGVPIGVIKDTLGISRWTVANYRKAAGIPRRTDWRFCQIAELLRMKRNGSNWWAISEEVGHTKGACASKYHSMKKEGLI